MLTKNFFTLLLMLICATAINAQLTVDPIFNSSDHGGGKQNGVFGGESDADYALLLPNGKIITSGFYGIMHNKTNQCVSLLNADGSIDPTFKAPGINDDLGDGITAMALQPDGKILLGGYISIYHGQNVYHLVRINANGDLDTSFHTGTGFNHSYGEVPRSIAIQTDGKIIIGGNFTVYNGNAVTGLIRLNADGSLDNSFNFISDSSTTINKILIEADGKYIVGGVLKMHSDTSYKNFVRLNTDGSLDTAFNPHSTIVINEVKAFDIQTDNKIVFACDSSVYRADANGTIDQNFIKGNIKNVYRSYYNTRIYDIKIQPDGKILLGGGISSYNNTAQQSIIRLNTDGSIDNSFSTATGFGGGEFGNDDNHVSSINLFSDGRIFIAGGFLFYRSVWQGTMAELNSDGSINNTFNRDNGNGADANVNKIAVQPDNKILIAGYFDTYNGIKRNKIARLNADGTLDNSFTAGTGPDSCNFINTIVLQNDGKILVGGNFAHFNNISNSFIVRLNNDGSIDNSFNFSALTKKFGDITDGVKAIALQNDGKVIIGFDRISNHTAQTSNPPTVLRLNLDGSLDSSFDGKVFSDYNVPTIYSIHIQPDGKILVGGHFYIGNTNNRNLLRLNSDGSLDATFNTGGSGPDGSVFSINLQTDNKIIISGEFESYNNAGINTLARLNTNGSLDASYSPAIPDVVSDTNYIINSVSIIDSNNKVTLSYLYYNDTTYGRVVRYNADGSIDSIFGTKNKTDYLVSNMALQDKKLLLGGFIESFNGIKRNHITRITTPEILSVNWLSVNAAIKNLSDVDVTWQTADELNVKNYTVQKSISTMRFSNLNTVLPGKGFSNKYLYTDINSAACNRKVYYRIMETDNDGKISYSGIASVDFINGAAFAIFPNPATNNITIAIPSSNAVSKISLFDINGKKILSVNVAANIVSKQININQLSSGVYNVVLTQNGRKGMMKLVKK